MGDIKLCKITVMKSYYLSLISEWENLQHPQEIIIPSLIICTSRKETLPPSTCQILIIKTRHIIMVNGKIQIFLYPGADPDHSQNLIGSKLFIYLVGQGSVL